MIPGTAELLHLLHYILTGTGACFKDPVSDSFLLHLVSLPETEKGADLCPPAILICVPVTGFSGFFPTEPLRFHSSGI